MINIKGLDKAEVLKALYDRSHIQGMGWLQAVPDGFVTVEHCRELLHEDTYFDYLYGRVLKVDLSGDEFDERLYDRDCGAGAARQAINKLRNISVEWGVTFDVSEMNISIREDFMKRTISIRGKDRDSLDKLIWYLQKARKDIDADYKRLAEE